MLFIPWKAFSISFSELMDSLLVSPAAPWPLEARTLPSSGFCPWFLVHDLDQGFC